MSAWICTLTHVKSIVAWAANHGVRDVADRQREVAQMLHDENVTSVNYRYSDDVKPETVAWDGNHNTLTAVEVIKACQCLDYQSCEHDGWATSDAKAFLDRVIATAIGKLPGYESAPWGIEDREEVAA